MNSEELKAYDLAVENHERAMTRVAELEREVDRMQATIDGLDRQNDYLAEEIASLKQQPTHAGDDAERAMFQSWMIHVEGSRFASRFDRVTAGPFAGDYRDGQAQGAWNVWQARASLPVGVPNGYAIVPVKPDIEMVEAGYEASLGQPDRSAHARVIEQYDAMLAAAHQPAAQENVSAPDECNDLNHHERYRAGWNACRAAILAAPAQSAAQDQGEVRRLREALEGMLEYFPEGASDGECFAVDAALSASIGQEAAGHEQ